MVIASAMAVAAAGTNTLSIYFSEDDDVPFAWEEISPLATARASPATVTLPNGNILVTGGIGSGGAPTATTEIFDSRTALWKQGPTMVTKRVGHTATLLQDGTVLIAGGETGSGVTSSAELLNTTAGSSVTLPAMSFARAGHAAILLATGKVLVSGGSNSLATTWKQAELYDPAAHRWAPGGSMTAPRVSFALNMLPGGTPIAIGGDKNGTSETYDPLANTWSGQAQMTAQRFSHGTVTMRDGRIMACGGVLNGVPLKTAELFDPDRHSWSATGSMKVARASFSITVMKNGTVLAAGSYSQQGTTNTAELFHPSNSTWTSAPPMVKSRGAQGFALLVNGTLLGIGGRSGSTITASVELFGPVHGVTPPPPPPPPPTILRPIDIVPLVKNATELPGQSGKGLIAKLEAAQAKYDLKDFATCINIMSAFYNQLRAFALGNHISEAHTVQLYNAYASVVTHIGGAPQPPIQHSFAAHVAWVVAVELGL